MSASLLFDRPLSSLAGVGPLRVKTLKNEWQTETYGALLAKYPFRYEDRRKLHSPEELPQYVNKDVQLVGTLKALTLTGPRAPLRGIFGADMTVLDLRWFHKAQWLLKKYKIGQKYLLYGRLQQHNGLFNIVHPELVPVEGGKLDLRIIPIYHSTDRLRRVGLSSQGIAKLQQILLPLLLPHIKDSLPDVLRKEQGLLPTAEAVRILHAPSSLESITRARQTLAFEELFFFQLHLLMRVARKKEKKNGFLLTKTTLLQVFYAEHMPFSLTEAQQCVMREIHADISSGTQMNRLLQGDVGSGKTIVAWLTLLIALSNGCQAALMAPTEVLATQHASLLVRYAEPMGISVALLSGSTPKKERNQLLSALATGQLQVLVGTHALLEPTVCFHTLGLVIIDEQHRFGVAQRARLSEKYSSSAHQPHILVMTATPIPRTLALTHYGELSISTINELPKGRQPIRTAIRSTKQRAKIYDFIRSQLNSGYRAYIVYPLIEESEQLDLSALSQGYDDVKKAFKEYEVEQLHGRMKAEEKRQRMQRYVTGEAQLLVSTSVIEVGIDVPESTVMIIENADRFGLAQLHQLRGRIGRGSAKSYCILLIEGKISTEARARLRALTQTQDGFALAETDLTQRGPGNILGTQQSGIWRFEVVDLAQDGELLVKARHAAKNLLKHNPKLTNPAYPELQARLESWLKRQKDWMSIG